MMFKEKLQILCSGRGWDQSDLSRELGLRASTVGPWWHGKSRPDMLNGLKLARRLGVPLDFLADDTADFPATVPVMGAPVESQEKALLDLLREMEIPARVVREALVRGGTAILAARPAPGVEIRDPSGGATSGGPEDRPAREPREPRKPGQAG